MTCWVCSTAGLRALFFFDWEAGGLPSTLLKLSCRSLTFKSTGDFNLCLALQWDVAKTPDHTLTKCLANSAGDAIFSDRMTLNLFRFLAAGDRKPAKARLSKENKWSRVGMGIFCWLVQPKFPCMEMGSSVTYAGAQMMFSLSVCVSVCHLLDLFLSSLVYFSITLSPSASFWTYGPRSLRRRRILSLPGARSIPNWPFWGHIHGPGSRLCPGGEYAVIH